MTKKNILGGLVWVAAHVAFIVLTGEPEDRARRIAIFVPLAVLFYASGLWMRARRATRVPDPNVDWEAYRRQPYR